jgi:hypothetical protein
MTTHIWFLSIPIGAFVLLPLFKKRWQRARDDRIGQRAESAGWTVIRSPGFTEWCSQLPGGSYRGISQMLSRTENGWPVSVAEYSYYDGTGDSRRRPDRPLTKPGFRLNLDVRRDLRWRLTLAQSRDEGCLSVIHQVGSHR